MNTLDTFIAQKLHEPFRYGVNDCITFSAEAIRITTGIDHLKDIKKWNSEMQASKLLKRMGYKSLTDVIDSRFRQHTNINKLQDGDVVTAEQTLDKRFNELALIYYQGYLLGPAKDGLHKCEVSEGKNFFNVRSLRLGYA